MSVYKAKHSTFYHYDFTISGRRFYGTTGHTRRREAEAVERIERAKAEEIVRQEKALAEGPETFDLAAGRYWEDRGKYNADHKAAFVQLGRLTATLGNKRLMEIAPADIADLVARRRGEGVANATVNRQVTQLLRKVLRYAKERGQPVPNVKWGIHMLPEPQERIRELTSDEETALENGLREDFQPIWRFSVVAGVRLKEAVTLTWASVDWEARVIRILGKGDRVRLVPITSEIREILWPLRGHHSEAVFTYVCTRSLPKRRLVKGERYPITYNGLKVRWRRDRSALGLTDYRWHDNRHTAATRLLRDTGNIRLVQRLLGHAKIETTTKYAHADLSDLAEGMERVTKSRRKSRRAPLKVAK